MKILHLLIVCFLSIGFTCANAGSPYSAARNGDLEVLRQYRFEGIDLFIPDARGFIPYELAALHADPGKEDTFRNYVEIMLWLKEFQASKHTYGKASNALVQAGLNALGYDAGLADGVLGEKTKEAIKAFQRDNELAETGRLGPQWLGLFYQDTLKDLQFKLSKIGYPTYGTDGKMGSKTRAAMIAYRQAQDLLVPDYDNLDGLLITSVNKEFNSKEKQKKTALADKARKQAMGNIRFAQAGLHNLGYRVGKIDGMTGSKTANAIKKFQNKYSLKATGELDKSTLKRMQQAFTKDTQEKLNALGYATGKPDGKMGGKTLSAIKKYSKSNSIENSGRITASLFVSLKNNYSKAERARKNKAADKNESNNTARVKFAQAGLRTLGKPISVDGIMGSTTAKYIKNFQKRYKLKQTARVDDKTYAKMNAIFLKESQRKLNVLGFKVGNPDGQMGNRTRAAIKKYRQQNGFGGSGVTASLIAAIDDGYDSRNKKKRIKTVVNTVKKTTTSSKKQATSTPKKTTSKKTTVAKATKKKTNKTVVASKGVSNRRSAKGRMTFNRKSGRVVGCSLAGRNIPIEWCEPFYPLPKNNHCEATFKPSNGAVINLWCK